MPSRRTRVARQSSSLYSKIRSFRVGSRCLTQRSNHSIDAAPKWIVKAVAADGLQSALVSVYDDDLGNTLVVARQGDATVP